MAYISDVIWCHPKFQDISEEAFAVWVRSLAYSSGFATRGHLTAGQQRLIKSTPRVRQELLEARLWDLNGDGTSVVVHDWEDHNAARDARREADRERKRLRRQEGKA